MTATMEEPKTTSLYYREGSSDKEYHVRLEAKDNGYVVNFAYGRRGSTLTTGTKTSAPVYYDAALMVFDKLVKEKKAKGFAARVDSYFFGTELASSGLPEGRERAILESVKDKVPASVFTTPYTNPVNGSPEAVRTNLREAVRLFQEAGYEIRGNQMVEKASGQPFTVEFLGYDNSAERIVLPYRAALERIGLKVTLRVVDPAQYQNLVRSFDFDALALNSWAESLSPGNEQRDFWGSAAADRPGSRNLAGIKDPGIDALIDKVIYAGDREELVAATRALDRVLDRKSTRLNSSHTDISRMPSSA